MFGYTIISKKRLRELESPANVCAKYYLYGYEAGKQDAFYLYMKYTPNGLRKALDLEQNELRKALDLEQIIKEKGLK